MSLEYVLKVLFLGAVWLIRNCVLIFVGLAIVTGPFEALDLIFIRDGDYPGDIHMIGLMWLTGMIGSAVLGWSLAKQRFSKP
jgi:hypothetical protein